MTPLTFTGSLEYIPYTIERYEEKGYELVRYRIIKNRKFGELVEVTMERKVKVNGKSLMIFVNGEPISCSSSTTFEVITKDYIPNKTLQERLAEALEREDYELAAILRDKIKEL